MALQDDPNTQQSLSQHYSNFAHPAMDAWIRFVNNEFLERMRPTFTSVEYEQPSLLDTFEAWLVYGDAHEVCETFENYLITVISILAAWVDEGDGDRGYVRESFDLVGIEPVLDERTPISRLQAQAWRHPALSRTVWDLAGVSRVYM